ncbi:hypothetical protein SAMN03159496_04479 [Rhizobium sp. NFR07]|nr:hypothetical protein SAMN03159496_04479 [Rhizobium sp. NFR07]
MIVRYALAVVTLALSTASVLAQAPSFNEERSSGETAYDMTLNPVVTQAVLRDFDAIRAECAKSDQIYRPDCIRQGLELTSRRIPFHGDYGAMRQTLRQTSMEIASEVSSKKDPNRDRLEIDPDTNVRFRSRRYYTPVKISEMTTVKTRVSAALDACQSRLLKLADRSTSWNKNYTVVAVGVSRLSSVLR